MFKKANPQEEYVFYPFFNVFNRSFIASSAKSLNSLQLHFTLIISLTIFYTLSN